MNLTWSFSSFSHPVMKKISFLLFVDVDTTVHNQMILQRNYSQEREREMQAVDSKNMSVTNLPF